MRYPDFLPTNGSIGFAAPSFGAFIEPYHTLFNHALTKFQEKGYQTILGPNVYKGDGIGISTDPVSCGKELTDMYLADDSDALISVGGGELMCEILDHVDFDALKNARPKWFMGYSDNTNFSYLSATILDTASIYGPNASSFGMEPWHPSICDAFNVLTGKNLSVHNYDLWEISGNKDETHPFLPYNVTEPTTIRIHMPSENNELHVSGRFLGGCMDCLSMLVGTCYDQTEAFCEKYKDDGIIFFLEACDLNIFSIRRVLWQMKHAGWFRYVKAFVFGRPLQYGQNFMGLDQYSAVLGVLSDLNVPILMDTDIGHLPPQMPIINGGYGDLYYSEGKLTIDFSLR